MKVDVIIPVYRPGRELEELLRRIERQTVPIHQVILMNTEKNLLEAVYREEELRSRPGNLRIFHLSKEEFDHGGTRRVAVSHSDADIFVMMTQDALPADKAHKYPASSASAEPANASAIP